MRHFTIENEHGKIEFMEPVNLFGENLAEIIDIRQNAIEIYKQRPPAPGVGLNRPCILTFNNIGNIMEKYPRMSDSQYQEFVDKLEEWMEKNRMSPVRERPFDPEQGKLVVTI